MKRLFTEENIQITNMHIKICLLTIREMEIKTIMGYHYINIRIT